MMSFSIRSIYSGVSVGTHHIFFQPRLYAAFLEVSPERNRGYGGYFFVFDELFLKEFQCPVIMSFWGIGAGQSDQVSLQCFREFRGTSGSGEFSDRGFESVSSVAIADSLDSTLADTEFLGDSLATLPFMREEENSGSRDHASGMFSFVKEHVYF
jgi:hypothetical protein